MAMSNDVSHPLVKLLCNGFAARALTTVWPSAPASRRLLRRNVKVALSAASRKASRPSGALPLGAMVDRDQRAPLHPQAG